jgi:uncharacterized protein (TIGR02588 family)
MQASERDGEEMNGTHLAVLIIGIIFGWLIKDSMRERPSRANETEAKKDIMSEVDILYKFDAKTEEDAFKNLARSNEMEGK